MPRVVVIGAGAAGTMASIFAASAGAETLLVESTKDGGRKILISGGGRCNILPSRLDESRFVTDSSPRTLRHIVRSWPLQEQIAFFEQDLDLPLVEEPASSKLFPKSQSARDVRDKLLAHARRKGVTVLTDTLVTDLSPSADGWTIDRQDDDPIRADAVIVATGGLSVPNTGSDGRGLDIARRLGHVMHPTYPALTPLTVRLKPDPTESELQGTFSELKDTFSALQGTFSEPKGTFSALKGTFSEPKGTLVASGFSRTGSPFGHLSGVSLPVRLTARSGERTAVATGGFLFTHHGYSGPSVLDVSHVAVRSIAGTSQAARLTVRWTPLEDADWDAALRPSSSRTVLAAVSEQLPHRLAEALLSQARIDLALPLAQLTRDDRLRLIDTLVRGELPWTGDEGYKKAEVTGGGVSLYEIDPKTLESRRHRGLFLCGEILDAFGPIGGYNFLWAWVTGRAAGIGAAAGATL